MQSASRAGDSFIAVALQVSRQLFLDPPDLSMHEYGWRRYPLADPQSADCLESGKAAVTTGVARMYLDHGVGYEARLARNQAKQME